MRSFIGDLTPFIIIGSGPHLVYPGGSSMAAWWIHTMSSLFNVLNSAGVICRKMGGGTGYHGNLRKMNDSEKTELGSYHPDYYFF